MSRNPRTGAKLHTHKYHRMKNGKWFCALPDCTHFWPGNLPVESLYGKTSICWGCGNTFKLDAQNMENDRPECVACMRPKELTAMEEFLADIKE